jgi:hypothetical protein
MNAIEKQGLERAAKVAQVIAEHPDLPMLCLAPSTPSDYSTYYHDVMGAEVEQMLFPNEVAELYGDFYGLDCDRYYDDVDDVSERIEDYWLWDNDHGRPMECLDDDDWHKVYGPIADMMAEDMPWHEYIVIDCR